MNRSISVCIHDSMQNVGDWEMFYHRCQYSLWKRKKSPCAEFLRHWIVTLISQTRTTLHLRLNTSSTTVYKTTFAWKPRVVSITMTRSSSETQGVHPPSMISNHLWRVFRITDEATAWTLCTFSTCSIPNPSRNGSINATQPLGSRVKTSRWDKSLRFDRHTNNYTSFRFFFTATVLLSFHLIHWNLKCLPDSGPLTPKLGSRDATEMNAVELFLNGPFVFMLSSYTSNNVLYHWKGRKKWFTDI